MQCDIQSSEERKQSSIENIAQRINELSVNENSSEEKEMAEVTGINPCTNVDDDSRTFATLECINSHKVYTLPEENSSNEFKDAHLEPDYFLETSETSNNPRSIISGSNACNMIKSSSRVPPSSLSLDLSNQGLEPELASCATPSPIASESALSLDFSIQSPERELASCATPSPNVSEKDLLVSPIDHDRCSVISSTGTDFGSVEDSENHASRMVSEEEVSESGEIACGMSENVANKLYELKTSQDNILDDFSSCSLTEENSDDPDFDHQCQQESQNYLSGSRSSLRQVYPYISCLPFENNIVFCYILSVWDNIVGPQTVYVWRRKSFPSQRNIDRLNSQDPSTVGTPDPNFSSTPAVELGEDSVKSQHSNSFESLSDRDGDLEESDYVVSKGRVSSIPTLQETDNKNAFHSISNSMISHSSPPSPKLPSHRRSDSSRTGRKSKDTQSEDGRLLRQRSGGAAQNSKRASMGDEEHASSWAYGSKRLRLSAVVKYVTEHSVGVGEIGKPSEKVTTTLLVVPQQGIVVVAARFQVAEEGCGVPYCLCMVVPMDEYNYFLPLTQFATQHIINIAAHTKLQITKNGLEGGRSIRNKLIGLCEVLVALRSASLDQYPLTPAGQPPDDRILAELVLTSHLQTAGTTLVIGDSPNAANKVVMWVAQFSDPQDLHISRLCLSYTQWPFHPGLAVQGIVRGVNGSVALCAEKLLLSPRPVTVVDLSTGTVRQTSQPHLHSKTYANALHQQLLADWNNCADVASNSKSLLEPVRSVSPLVKQFLRDYDRLISCEPEVRRGLIEAFLRSLKYTALALITWTQHEWAVVRHKSGYGSLRRALGSVFDLEEADLKVILSQADQLHPGFYAYVMA